MKIEDPDLIQKDLIIHEFLEDGKRYLVSFFTTDNSLIVRHLFSLIGLKNTEAMTISSDEVTSEIYQSIAASDRERKVNISAYTGNPIKRAVISVDHVFERGRAYQDIAEVALQLEDGRKLVFSANSAPPFVPFMSISEIAPVERPHE
jgi:hypothetical protein